MLISTSSDFVLKHCSEILPETQLQGTSARSHGTANLSAKLPVWRMVTMVTKSLLWKSWQPTVQRIPETCCFKWERGCSITLYPADIVFLSNLRIHFCHFPFHSTLCLTEILFNAIIYSFKATALKKRNCIRKNIGGGTKLQNQTNILGMGKTSKAWSKTKFTSCSNGSRIDEGHCNVAGAVGGGEAFVEVSQSSWVHEGPTFPRWFYGAVIPVETTAPTLKVSVFVIEGDVDGEGGGVVVGPQVRLSLRRVFYNKVHYSITLRVIAGENF